MVVTRVCQALWENQISTTHPLDHKLGARCGQIFPFKVPFETAAAAAGDMQGDADGAEAI